MLRLYKVIFFGPLIILCFILSSCTSSNIPGVNSKWVLESLTMNGEQIDLNTAAPVTLDISEKDQVAGSAGCNSYGGDLKFKAQGKLEVGNLFQTEMWCDIGMDVESAYLNSLSAATQYEMIDNKLVLSTQDGNPTLIFILVE